ncbi:hypothetical protein ACLBYG_19305 [Methylobacterium sp. D53M]|jgi:hypothetical protein
MPYTLHRLAPGSYDLLLDESVIGSVTRDVTKSGLVRGWDVEQLDAVPPLPAPFTQEAYRFETMEAAVACLGGAAVRDDD